MKTITYKDSGVDIAKADRLIDGLKGRIRSTHNAGVLNMIGGFAALTEVPGSYRNPVLVSSTDGVGTKLKIAFMAGKHDTVGIDLVGMSVNDILTLGAKPLFFLDYYACGKIDENVYPSVVGGVCDGCLQADCALVGGETAEMPSFYKDDEYDLAGFAVGVVEKDSIIDGSTIAAGDAVVGLSSNGLHSNGFSLVRKLFFDVKNYHVDDEVPGIPGKLYEELLKPTRIYVKPVLNVISRYAVKGMAHITGGGLPGNISRIIPDGLATTLRLDPATIPPVFRALMEAGNLGMEEACSTFNMGTGFVLIVNDGDADAVVASLNESGEKAARMGTIEKAADKAKVTIIS
ncbi:MAG: Phosphoribosylformylglycinamidine cyclo-ligase [Syntrophorhabdus sp. PtaB.Bin047]|nr:MAG: Phosphoribosylformylglycinamidine cyclo-ligase [Syntrophorhabdus sp. PtaB.Bin047]